MTFLSYAYRFISNFVFLALVYYSLNFMEKYPQRAVLAVLVLVYAGMHAASALRSFYFFQRIERLEIEARRLSAAAAEGPNAAASPWMAATAQTRRVLLERLLPRLKIADRCTLADRFLVVRGNLRSYKIHLGSGNILMTPNDQYLCIVPKQSAKAGDRFFLPFEGDGTLSVILSKAFLLADDTKITDPTIVSQIKR